MGMAAADTKLVQKPFPKGDERKTFVGCHVGIRQSKKLCNEKVFSYLQYPNTNVHICSLVIQSFT